MLCEDIATNFWIKTWIISCSVSASEMYKSSYFEAVSTGLQSGPKLESLQQLTGSVQHILQYFC